MKKLWLIIKNIFTVSTKTETIKEPTQLELYRQFGEEVLIDCGIDLRNVLIKPAYDNDDGVIFNYSSSNQYKVAYTTKDLKKQPYNYSNTLFYGETYMILPEIVDLYTLCVWIHETGHYMMHINDTRPDFVKEYEAEMYVNTIIKLCPIEKPESCDSKNYPLRIHQIELTYYMILAQDYVKSFIKKDLTKPNMGHYLSKDIESFINTKIKYPE